MLKRPHPRFKVIFGLLLWVGLSLSGTLLGQKTGKPLRVQSTDPVLRIKGFEASLEMVKSSPFKGMNWSHIGPTNVSGRCTDIAVVAPRGKSYTIYVATATGGGKTWGHMGLADSYTIARIVVHPQNPDIVYVAASGHEWTDNAERGVFKSADGGKTWEKVLFVNARTA